MRLRTLCLAAATILAAVLAAGCGGGGNEDLFIFEELEAASSVDDPADRIDRLNIFVSAHPDHMARTIACGRIFETMYRDLGETEEALSWMDGVVAAEQDPLVRGDLLYRKFALLWKEDKEAAVGLASEILDSDEKDYRVHLYLCYYLMDEEGREELAEGLFEKLLTLAGDGYRADHARSVYGEFLMARGREDDAVKVLLEAGSYPFANQLLGDHYLAGGDTKKAVDAYIDYVAGAPGAVRQLNIDSLYAAAYPGADGLDKRIMDSRLIDEGVLPDAEFSDLRGKTHLLSSYRGTPLIISAWSPT